MNIFDDGHAAPADMRQRIEATTELPAMPEAAQALLKLSNDPQGNIQDLVDIIEQDPSIAAQIMRYARSAFFAYSGEITSLQQAVTAVLGYNLSLDIAIGLSLGKAFNIPDFGPLGLYPFWRHAVYSAALCQRLSYASTGAARPQPGLAFLAGLLHNFGVLLVAHLFRKEALQLARRIEADTARPVIDIEREMLGADHPEVGAWLLRHWNLQGEIVVSVAQHHQPQYAGEHAGYAHMVLLADRLLKRHGIGDAESEELPEALLSDLGLSAEDAEASLAATLSAGADLDLLARQFPA
ncbi:MAG TPA: HDOD domain-containing protein [Gammaproteobacteria bacterium]|nr:HDOD domain-containing protein [Gammaproteobacteria bacterium]